jgi:hypothetical protein
MRPPIDAIGLTLPARDRHNRSRPGPLQTFSFVRNLAKFVFGSLEHESCLQAPEH